MNDATVELVVRGAVAEVVLSRPGRRNAFDTAMLARMEAVVAELSRMRDVHVVVLRALGPTFCAGTDLAELEHLDGSDTLHWQRRTGELVERWARLDATTLTAFQGPAVGSGAIVGLASDLRIAAEGTWFSFPELGFGIPLTWSGVAVLVALMGADRAKRALLLQQRLDTAEIERLGLVAEVVRPDALEARTDELAARLARTSPLARSMTKRAVAAAAAAPGFATSAFDPFLAALSIERRSAAAFLPKDDRT